MATAPPASRHIVRWIVVAIVAVLLALVVALAVHVHNLLQPDRFTALLENNLAGVGMKLRMQAPAEPTLFPHPGVQLQGFSLTNTGSDTPVLQASGATIVVPWRALLHGDVAIQRIDVNAPRVDLGELQALFAKLPRRAGPPRLPDIATGVQMRHGTLTRDGAPLLFDFSVSTGALAPGQEFQLEASARTATGRRVLATLATVPSSPHDGAIDFDALKLGITQVHGAVLQLAGRGSWRGGEDFSLHLQGNLRHRALAPPPSASATSGTPGSSAAAASAATADTVSDNVVLNVAPAQKQIPLTVALKLDGVDSHVDLSMQPTELGRWWSRLLAAKPGAPSPPLPLTGSARVQQLNLGWIKASGLSIDAGPDLAPASAPSSAPATASSTATAH